MRQIVCLLMMCVGGPSYAGVVVNEFVPNPDGTDSGNEWIELYNNGDASIDLQGWSIERAKSTWSARWTFDTAQVLEPDTYLVIGDEGVVGADLFLGPGETLDLGNASSDGDGVRIVDADGTVVDVVVYGPNNDNALENEEGAAVTEWAPKPGSGQSVARRPNGVDTNVLSSDFDVVSEPTLGGSNGDGPPPPDCDVSEFVVINEIMASPSGADDGNEWVELYNPEEEPINVSGWTIASGPSSFSTDGQIPVDTWIDAKGYLVVAQSSNVVDAVIAAGFSLGNGFNSDGVRIEDCYGALVDTVIYGAPNSDEWVDDSGMLATSLAPKPSEGKTLARLPDGGDTDQSGIDFVIADFPTPGLANDSEPEDCGATTSGVVINEFLANPEGTDDGYEWVELYNSGEESVRLTGWGLQKSSKGTSGYGSQIDIEEEVILEVGGYYVVGGQFVSEAQTQVAKMGLNNGSGGDGLRLVDCAGFTADTVVYGSNNEDEVEGDGNTVATSLAPNPTDNLVLARVVDGYDTDESGVDFAASLEATPGTPNPEREPVICIPADSGIVINEVLPDPTGDDAGFEWFELFNTTNEDISVAGWWVSLASKYDQIEDVDFRFPGGIVVPANGYLVVGGEGVDVADVIGSFSMGNGTGGDGILLYTCEDQLLDIALYGDQNIDGIPNEDGFVVDPAGNPGNDQSLARRVDGEDSDEVADWFIDFSPTPGFSNETKGNPSPGGDEGCGKERAPGTGCAGGAPSSSDPSGCGLVLTPFGGWELLALLVAMRRRRRTS